MEYVLLHFSSQFEGTKKKPYFELKAGQAYAQKFCIVNVYYNDNIYNMAANPRFLKFFTRILKQLKKRGTVFIALSDGINVSSVRAIVYRDWGFKQCDGTLVKAAFVNIIIKSVIEHSIAGFKEGNLYTQNEWGVAFDNFDSHVGYLIELLVEKVNFLSVFTQNMAKIANFERNIYKKTGISLNVRPIDDEYINSMKKLVYFESEHLNIGSIKSTCDCYNMTDIMATVQLSFAPIKLFSFLKEYFDDISDSQAEFFILAFFSEEGMKSVNAIEQCGFLLKSIKMGKYG